MIIYKTVVQHQSQDTDIDIIHQSYSGFSSFLVSVCVCVCVCICVHMYLIYAILLYM